MKNYLNLRKKLCGPIFSIITPFKKNGKIDYDSLKNYLKYLYLNGAKNFYVMAYNSRLTLLNKKEILSLNLFCIKQVKKLNKDNIIICGEPYHCSTDESIDYAKYFEKNGADIVSVIFGEKFYSEDQLYSHFKEIHNKTNCFLLLHQQILENGISSNPNFVNAEFGDFELMPHSPCLNSGHPDFKYNNLDGSRNTMGAYGGPGALE